MSDASKCLPIDHGGPVDRPFEVFPYSALEGSVLDRFDTVVSRFPERLAIQDTTRRLTYADLAAMVDRIAAAAMPAIADRAGPVAILLQTEVRFPAAMLGVLAAGRAYVPLDADQPIARNQLIATQAGASLVLSAGDLAEHVRTLFPHELPVLDLDSLADLPHLRPSRRPGPGDVAYVVYTSGSTGTPKGVYQNHRGLLHDVLQYTNALHLDCEDRLSTTYSPSGIGAVRDIYGALLNGASVHILPPRELKAAGLVQEIRARGITVLRTVPALLRRVIEALGVHERLESVRIVALGADRIGWTDFDDVRRSFSSGAFLYVNLGSTECTTVAIHWFVDESVRATSAQLPVGRAIPDRTVIVADENGAAAADGEVGELIVASRYIGLGYWGAPELSNQAFGVDATDPETRIFRTGDLGRRRPDGLIEFVGRKDEQVKLRGHRIEPAEVESAIINCPDVADAAVVVRRDAAGLPRSLAAYVVLRPAARGLLPRHLAAMLQQRLPRYMVPWPIITVEELPRLSNFKIDRPQLALMDTRRTGDLSHRATDEMIHAVAEVFERVLGVEGAMPDDDLSSLGGDSLQAITIATELGERFSVDISEELLDSARTIQELARWIASQRAAGEPHRAHGRAQPAD